MSGDAIESRRRFLQGIAIAAAAPAVGAIDDPPQSGLAGRLNDTIALRRARAAYWATLPVRVSAPRFEGLEPHALYAKGLPRARDGLPDAVAVRALQSSSRTGTPAAFDAVPTGGALKLTSPLSAFEPALTGPDACQLDLAAPPAWNSRARMAELAELYAMALARDVPFERYADDPGVVRSAREIARLGIGNGEGVHAFRGAARGDAAGPYVSQFLLKRVPYGAQLVDQRYQVSSLNADYLADRDTWLACQRGDTMRAQFSDSPTRFIHHGRSLAEYVRRDFTIQPFLNAALILLSWRRLALSDANPYRLHAKQYPFVAFGGPDAIAMLGEVSSLALKATWFWKWCIDLDPRPEELGGLVHLTLAKRRKLGLDAGYADLELLARTHERQRTWLLSSSYPEGAPSHPSYPAGHAALAGACITVLKAMFKESFAIPEAVHASLDGQSLLPLGGGVALTVGGELDKLASNIAFGRNFAGIHYRSDALGGIRLGEDVALGYLSDACATYRQTFSGFTLTRYDGTRCAITAAGVARSPG